MSEIRYRLWNDRCDSFEYWGNIEKGTFKGVPAINGTGIDENCNNSEQFTGLKDKNGVEIYKGDIIIFRDIKFKIVFECSCFQIEALGSSTAWCGCTVYEIIDELELIGNIHKETK